jgi:hypothetical protein
MSTDEQLRTRLATATEHLVPDLDMELARMLRRSHRRRRTRTVGVVAVAAAVTGFAWLVGVPGTERSQGPVGPVGTPDSSRTGPTDLVGVRGPLEPGRYSMAAWGPDGDTRLPRAIVEVPRGYFSNGGWAVDAGGPGESDQWGEVMVWPVARVSADTCDDTPTTRVGPTVRDLARALADQTGSTTTEPRPVTLDGHRGLYLELTTPDTNAGCTSHALWRSSPELVYGQDTGRIVHHLWLLDVDGTRLVVAVSNYPDQTPRQHQELIDIAKTIHLVEPTGP